MRISYYYFPEEMSIREVALVSIKEFEGNDNITEIPSKISDETLEQNFPRIIDCSVSTVKKMIKKYGGKGFTQHIDRNGGLFETTEIKIKGNNSKHKYNRHL